jgi:plasmid replication initiation protein
MSNSHVIRKDNRIIAACYKLTLNEQRLILTAIAKIPYDQKVPADIDITAQEFLSFFPDVGANNVHAELQEAVSKLYERSVIIENPIKKKKFRWISAMTTYKQGEGRVSFTFSPEIIAYLEQLKEQFTKYRLGDISNLKSIYSIRLYEMMMQFQHTKFIRIELDKFKERLGVADKYTVFKDLRRNVIEIAVNELNAKSLFNVTFTPIRQGRAIKTLTFNFSERSR